MTEINIGKYKIGKDNPCFIIVEAGVNHNGDINIAKKLIDNAVNCDADAIKFQTFKADLIVTKNAEQAEYQKKSAKDDSQYTMLKKLELNENEFEELKSYCEKKKIIFLSTPHSDKWSVDVLENLNIAFYKIGSGDLTNIPILRYVAKKNKPIIIGTGMANIDEILEAKKEIENFGNENIIFLQCTTMYPTPNKKVNLNSMKIIKEATNKITGFSDHTTGLEASIISACLGASVIEKHFTLDKNMQGPDHQASMEPKEMKSLIKAIKFVNKNKIINPKIAFDKLNLEKGYNLNKNIIKSIMGKNKKLPEPEEIEIAKIARKSVVAIENISKGEILDENNLGIRRPGEGLSPKYYFDLKDKKANKNITKDNYIYLLDVQ
jgi:N,N'-diacetyllegionaminate synthase